MISRMKLVRTSKGFAMPNDERNNDKNHYFNAIHTVNIGTSMHNPSFSDRIILRTAKHPEVVYETEEEMMAFSKRLYEALYCKSERALRRAILNVIDVIAENPEKNYIITCACDIDKPCHSDIIIECVNSIMTKGYWDPAEGKYNWQKTMSAA